MHPSRSKSPYSVAFCEVVGGPVGEVCGQHGMGWQPLGPSRLEEESSGRLIPRTLVYTKNIKKCENRYTPGSYPLRALRPVSVQYHLKPPARWCKPLSP